MDKFTTNQFAEETTAADIYAMREEFRQEEQELAEIADAQWHAFQDDHDTDFYEWIDHRVGGRDAFRLYDMNSMSMTCAQAEWEAQQGAELSDFDPHPDFYCGDGRYKPG